jgi:predicted 3-demethylubiquinone-9 3-methyltransferase (glyoxalase superfamily)
MQKITPFLWFDGKAEEAMNFYTSIFKNSKIGRINHYGEAGPGPKGTVMSVTFQLEGQDFYALNGGPEFSFTPAVSFFVNCETQEEIDGLWKNLSEGGTVLMELNKYLFSEKFGWVLDQFGVSWQLNLASSMQKITPFLMFVGKQQGKAEDAINFYTSIFNNSSIISMERYGTGEDEHEGTVKRAKFLLNGQEFMAIDSNRPHPFTFTPAISFFVNCKTQEEVDELWNRLLDGGESQGPGWIKDKYGLSWQIVPAILGELLNDPNPEKSQRVMNAMLQMEKLDIEKLKHAYKG